MPLAGGVTDADPVVGSVPFHAPLALQEVALVLDQVMTSGLPAATVTGFAEMVTVGAAVVVETRKANDLLAAVYCALPAKAAVRGTSPDCTGLSEHDAVPIALVVALHETPPNVKVTV